MYYKAALLSVLANVRVSHKGGKFSSFEQDKCTCDNFWIWVYIFSAYKGILMAFGVYLAYDTRQIRVPFLSDSRFMAVAVYTAVASCLMLFILLHVDIRQPDVYYVLMSILCIIFTTVPLLLIFLPKVFVCVCIYEYDRYGQTYMPE